MKALAFHYEYLADARAEKLVEARRAVRETRERFEQAKLCNEINPSRESRLGFEEAEFALWRAERTERALSQTTSDARTRAAD